MKRLCIASFIFLSIPLSLEASLFSGNGFGELVPPINAKSRGLGGAGIGYEGSRSWDVNPSLLGSLRRTSLSFSLNSELCRHEDSSGDAWTSNFKISDLKFALPLPHGVVAGVSLNKRFDMEFDVGGIPGTLDTVEYQRSITSRGGVYSTAILLAREIGDLGSFGASFNLLSGSAIEEWLTEFTDPQIRPTADSLSYDFLGRSLSLGILAKLGSPFRIGLSFTSPAQLTGDFSTTTPIQEEELSYLFPATYGAGCSYRWSKRFLFASDLTFYPWQELQVNEETTAKFINTHRFALGFLLLPSSDELASFWRKFPLRLGYSNAPWYFRTKDGGKIQEQSLTLGTSLPIAGGQVDLSLELGERRGGDLTEMVLRGGITFSGGEAW